MRRRSIEIAGLVTLATVWSVACGQDGIILPKTQAGGVCHAGYPTPVADNGGIYGLEPGNTFPCMVFESVRNGSYDEPQKTHLNVDDVHISHRIGDAEAITRQFGVSSDVVPRYILFVSAAVNCPECTKYLHDLSENSAALEAAGVLPVAVANNDLLSPDTGLDVETSEALLAEDEWPTPWLRTNDEVDNLTSQMAVWPSTLVVRIEDMKVMINNSGIGKADDLLAEIARQDAAFEVDAPQVDNAEKPDTSDEPVKSDEPDAPDGPLCSTCPGPVCMAKIDGLVLFSDGTPCADCSLQICTPACKPLLTDESGKFVYDLGAACRAFDFEVGDPVHFQLLAHRDTHATYSAEYAPTQQELGDDATLHTGTHYLYPFGAGEERYDGTASVELKKDGLQVTVAPGELEVPDGESLSLNVMRFPLDEWVPPFVEDASKLDALYVLSPYFVAFVDPAGAKEVWPVEVSVESSALGWDDQTVGHVRMLGDYFKTQSLVCSEGGENETQGALTTCGPTDISGGRVHTTIPRLGWLAFESE